jgi:hypothetical protein
LSDDPWAEFKTNQGSPASSSADSSDPWSDFRQQEATSGGMTSVSGSGNKDTTNLPKQPYVRPRPLPDGKNGALADIAMQAPQGFNLGLDSILNTPYNLIRSGAGMAGYDIPPARNLISEQINTGIQPQTSAGRIARTVGEVAGANVIPAAGAYAAAARAAPLVAPTSTVAGLGHSIIQNIRANPGAALRADVVSTAGAGLGAGIAQESGYGPVGVAGATFAGGLSPALMAPAIRGVGAIARDVGGAFLTPVQTAERNAMETIAKEVERTGIPPHIIAEHMGYGPGGTSEVPFNMADATTAAARALGRPGADVNVTNQALYASATGGKSQQAAKEALLTRQSQQPERLQTLFDQMSGGRNIVNETERLDDAVRTQAAARYRQAQQNGTSVDLKPAIDNFLSSGTVPRSELLAVKTAKEPALASGIRSGMDLFLDEDGNGIALTVPQYMARRLALDHMISASKNGYEPTPLTGNLSALRKIVDTSFKNVNGDLKAADAIYHGASTAKEIMDMSSAPSVLTAGPGQRDFLARFAKMTPEQQDVARIGVLQRFSDMAKRPTDTLSGVAPARTAVQFTNRGTADLVNKIFQPDQASQILSELKREVIGSGTLANTFRGSGTPEIGYGIEQMTDLPRAAGQLASGNISGAMRYVGNKLSRSHIDRKNEAIVKALMSTDPQTLQNVSRSIQTAPSSPTLLNAARNVMPSVVYAPEDRAKVTGMPRGARQAADGRWYVPDPQRKGMFLEVVPH